MLRRAARWLLAVSVFAPSALSAQVPGGPPPGDGGGVIDAPPPPFAVVVTPQGATTPYRAANTSGYSVTFTVRNAGANNDAYQIQCFTTGNVTCSGIDHSALILAAGASGTVQATYGVGAPGSGQLKLRAFSDAVADTGYVNVPIVAAPAVTLVAPVLTTGSRSVVRTRQPLIRALFTPSILGIDTTATVLQWRGATVTGLARHSDRLLEWEVDSTRWLNVGDSAQAVVTVCARGGGCTTASRWVVLEADQRPVLGFSAMPLEALGSGFTAPFGLGVSVRRAEVETGLLAGR